MPLPEVHEIQQKITLLCRARCSDALAARIITSHSDCEERMHRCINSMSRDDAIDATKALYTRQEKILMRFEQLDLLRSIGHRYMPVDGQERPVRRFMDRLERVKNSMRRLSDNENIAVTIAMHQEFEDTVQSFAETTLFRGQQKPTIRFDESKQRSHWN